MQPLAADDVAAALADLCVGSPVNGSVERAGPETMPIADFVGRCLVASGDARAVVAYPDVPYSGAILGPEGLNPGPKPPARADAVRRLRGERRAEEGVDAAR